MEVPVEKVDILPCNARLVPPLTADCDYLCFQIVIKEVIKEVPVDREVVVIKEVIKEISVEKVTHRQHCHMPTTPFRFQWFCYHSAEEQTR